MKITLPTKKGNPNTNPELDFEQLVIIGANGSGKTRFGAKIEENNLKNVHRISAQKSLTFPKSVSPKSKSLAEQEFLIGSGNIDGWSEAQNLNRKKSSRWNGNFNTSLLNDYDKLMVLLQTEEYEESLSYKEGRIEKPTTKLDKIQKIWELVLPHQKLIKKAGTIEAYPTNNSDSKYNASEMSDGERVIFYLIGEVVCAPENSMIIIDEPEMHIHKSLVKKLFDLIENERLDCSFIYLTHDIDFAFSRQTATKIWAKSYDGSNVWDYEILDEETPIPEQLYLEVLGSRKPIIFLEGDNSSIDYELYNQIYSDYTLKSLGSCEKVIHSVKSFNEQNGFHHIESFGIIDRDRRVNGDVVRLNSKSIWVLDVAESENLLLLEDVVKSVSEHMGKNANEVFEAVKANLLSFFSSQLESQVLLHFKEALRRRMIEASNFEAKEIGEVIGEIDTNFTDINKQEIYDEIRGEFEEIVNTKDFVSMLRVFNLKNALIPNSNICELTDVKNKKGYLKLVVTLLKRNNSISEKISKAIDERIVKNAT